MDRNERDSKTFNKSVTIEKKLIPAMVNNIYLLSHLLFLISSYRNVEIS